MFTYIYIYIHIYAIGPDGLCVEFNERGTVSIRQLSYDIRKVFVSKDNIQYKERGRGIYVYVHINVHMCIVYM
jgi:hypothetical protein